MVRSSLLRCCTQVSLLAGLALAGCSAANNNSAATTSTTATTATTTTGTGASANVIANLQPFADATGAVATYASAGSIDTTGVFFQALGTNGRTCATCHQAAQGMSLTPAAVQALFASSSGADPLFNAFDGANCPSATAGDSTAHSLLLNQGLIRIGIQLPPTPAFSITAISDPYGCTLPAVAAGTPQTVSVYRRPLPTTAVNYLSNVMWDTRETGQPLGVPTAFSTNLATDLTAQAQNAVATHGQGSVVPSATQTNALIALMQGLYTAQATDSSAGSLTANGATGGAANLAAQNYYPGINDAFGQDPTGAKFNPNIFNLFTSWQGSTTQQQASIARGQGIFNTAPMQIENVLGINDNAALGSPATLRGSCGTCHDTPNVGSHSLPLPMDTGVARVAANEPDPNIVAGLAKLSPPSLPVYQITGCSGANGKPVTYTSTDPGHALSSGLCADVNRMKVPSLRGLAGRAPYFHNGSAVNLAELVAFYNARFQMNLNPQQQVDLVNFLNAL